MSRLFEGRAAESVAPFQHGLSLNPNDPQNFGWLNLLALAQLFARDVSTAAGNAKEVLKVRPWRPLYETLAACYAAARNFDEAR